ncbi:hypothetical protein D3C84_827330 [compost metagenome]
MPAGIGLTRLRGSLGKQAAVERHPVPGQQLPSLPATVAQHQQADARQVAGAHVEIGGADQRTAGIPLPDRRGGAQRREQRIPGILPVPLRPDHRSQGCRQNIAVATGIEKALARLSRCRPGSGVCGHIGAAAGVEHGHHRGVQRRVFVVFLPVQTAGPVQQVLQTNLGMGLHGRVIARDRVIEGKARLTMSHTQ